VKKLFFAYLVAASVAISASFAEFQINTYTSSYQSNPAVAADANGNFIVVWNSYGQDGNSNGIFGQQFNPDCTPAGDDEFQINTTTTGNQSEPDVAVNSAGSFVIVWQGPGISQEEIFARRFDPNGQPLNSEFRVNTTTFSHQHSPEIAISKTGSFVIVWESDQTAGSPSDVWWISFQLYDSNGTAVGTETTANLLSQCRNPDVAMDDNSNFTIVWTQDDIYHSSNLIMARQYNAGGSPKADPFEVSTVDFNSTPKPAIAMDMYGYFVIVWDSNPQSKSNNDINARRYNSAGTPLTEQFIVNTTTAGAQESPKVASNDQQFIVVWNSETIPGSSIRDIFGQRFEPARNPLGDEFRINTYLADDQKYPAVAMLPGGKFITVWQSMGQDSSNFGIFGEIGPKAGSADITHNGFVDFFDFSRLAQEWLKNQNPLTADLIDDNKIDELDLAAFCDQWLTPCYDCSQVDLNDDAQIDFIDYSRWAGDWLKQGPNLAGDITSDGLVTFTDLKPISFHWATSCQ